MWRDVYESARSRLDGAAGYYNDNVRVESPAGLVNVRMPIVGAHTMDLKLWPEPGILRAIEPYISNVPRLLHVSAEPSYQIHGFIHGAVLNELAPRGRPVPAHVPADVVRLFAELTAVPPAALPPVPADWPTGTDTAGFARRLSALTGRVWAEYRQSHAEQYAAFGFPAAPLAFVERAWATLTPRPLVCVHSDVHRRNIIVDGGVSHFLDWELALWGDPVYDLAVHLHKMTYLPAETDHLLAQWERALPAEFTAGWQRDLDTYLAHEQVKSAIVDTVRTAEALSDPNRVREPDLIPKMTAKINNAYRRWGIEASVDDPTVEAILTGPPKPGP